jgi:hypothetical protein
MTCLETIRDGGFDSLEACSTYSKEVMICTIVFNTAGKQTAYGALIDWRHEDEFREAADFDNDR